MSEAPKIEVVDSRRRVIRLCVVIVLAFALLSAPRYIYLTWSVWRDTNSPRCLNCLSAMIQPTTFLLMFINSGINPILYAFLSQRFRHAIAETFTFSKTKKTVCITILFSTIQFYCQLLHGTLKIHLTKTKK